MKVLAMMLATVGTLTVLVTGAPAAPIVTPVSSTFDTGSDGWTESRTTGEITWASTGGNPGGYMRFEYGTSSETGMLWAPAAFLGDWSALDGVGTLQYDHRIFQTGTLGFIDPYWLWLVGSGGSAWWEGATPTGPTDWVTVSVPIREDAGWHLSEGTWAGLLANVTGIELAVELVASLGPPGDIDGIDNVILTPEPATLSLLALGGLAVMRRRRRSIVR